MAEERCVIVEGLGGSIDLETLGLFLESKECPEGGAVDLDAPEAEVSPDGERACIVFEEKDDAARVIQKQYIYGKKRLSIKAWYTNWKDESSSSSKPAKIRFSYAKDYQRQSHDAENLFEGSDRNDTIGISFQDNAEVNIKKEIQPLTERVHESLPTSTDPGGDPQTENVDDFVETPRSRDAVSLNIDQHEAATVGTRYMSMPTTKHQEEVGSGKDNTVHSVSHPEIEPISLVISIPEENSNLLKKLIEREFNLRADIKQTKDGFEISGTKNDVIEAQLKLLATSAKFEMVYVPNISPTVMRMITEPPCYDDILLKFHHSCLDVFLFYKNDESIIVAKDGDTAAACLDLVGKEVTQKTYSLDRKEEEIVGTEAWQDFFKSQSGCPKVHMYTETNDTSIVVHVDGMSEEVDMTLAAIRRFVDSARVTEQVQLDQGICRLLRDRAKLEDLLREEKYKHYVSVTWRFQDSATDAKTCLDITGPLKEIEACRKDIENIVKGIQYEKVPYSKPGLTMKLMTETVGKRHLNNIEIDLHCTVDTSQEERETLPIEPKYAYWTWMWVVLSYLLLFVLRVLGLLGIRSYLLDSASDRSGVVEKSEYSGNPQSPSVVFGTSETSRTPRFMSSHRHRDHGPVKLKRGDLAKYKSDVLVCTVVHKRPDLTKAGALGKGFASEATQELETAYADLGSGYKNKTLPLGDVYMTTTTGKLQCKQVIFVPLREWNRRKLDNQVEVVKKIIYQCLNMAHAHKFTSIAFPTIGCGRLKFPPPEVAKCFAEVIPHWLELNASKMKVSVVCFDESIYKDFEAGLHPSKSKKETKRSVTDLSPSHCTPTGVNRRILCKLPTIAFHIRAVDSPALQKAKKEINSLIDELIGEIRYAKEYLKHLDDDEEARLLHLGGSCAVIYFDRASGYLLIAGQRQALPQVQGHVDKLLAEVEKRLKDPREIRRLEGDASYLVALESEETQIPKHWSVTTGTLNSIKEYFSRSCQTFSQVDQKMFHAIEKWMQACWDPSHIGHGADAKGLTHKAIKIKSILINQNPQLYRAYRTKLKQACGLCGRGLIKVKKMADLAGEAEVLSAVHGVAELEAIRVPEVNEYFLFHGSPSKVKDGIAKQGLDSRLSNKNLFGRGIYFAESTTKADQYADRGSRTDGSLFMYVCRVLLTDPFLCKQPTHFNRPPCNTEGCNLETCPQHDYHDSVIGVEKGGGVRLLFREFIVYEKERCYPEFLVEYERV